MDQYSKLWKDKYDELSKRLKAASINPRGTESIDELKRKLESLKTQKTKQEKLYADLKVEQKLVNDDTFEATLLQRQLEILMRREDQVKRNLQQLDFASSQEDYRVSMVDEAVAPKAPTNNKQIKYMAAAPVGLLFMVLGLFCLLEVKAERVA